MCMNPACLLPELKCPDIWNPRKPIPDPTEEPSDFTNSNTIRHQTRPKRQSDQPVKTIGNRVTADSLPSTTQPVLRTLLQVRRRITAHPPNHRHRPKAGRQLPRRRNQRSTPTGAFVELCRRYKFHMEPPFTG